MNLPKLFAEFLGTLVLVLMGCGSAVLAGANGATGVGLLGISFAFGLCRSGHGLCHRAYLRLSY